MLEKLRAHLKKSEGFTLIELLVVIAIIAILVIIVVVAINPVERLNEANDREAASNARSAGTLIGTCVTQELAAGNDTDSCDDAAGLNAYGNVPAVIEAGVTGKIHSDGAAIPSNICASQEGRSDRWWKYEHKTGEVASETQTAIGDVDCP